jgi:uncharacterized OsmC-like protein
VPHGALLARGRHREEVHVRILLERDDRVVLEAGAAPLTIEAPTPDRVYTPFHMLGSALASCTFSVLHAWAEHASLSAEELRIAVEWDFSEEPRRVSAMRVQIDWPGLPDGRMRAALRAAELCTIHATLQGPVPIAIEPAA